MDRIKRYIECYIPTETCNLRCHYCYITQQRKFNNKLARFTHTISEIKHAFSFDRLGGPCLINMCAGGETLLSNEVLPIVKELLSDGHYVSLVTNGTLTKRFVEIASWDEKELKHLFIKFSFHYLELKRTNGFESFFSNIELVKKKGVSITVEITPNDELIPFIDEIKAMCEFKLKTLCHITIARDDRTPNIDVLSKLDYDTFINTWSVFDSNLLDFKKTIFYKKRTEYCYAGDWSIYLNLENGWISQCYCGKTLGNIYDFSQPIHFEAIGKKCSLPHCYNGHAFLTLGVIPELTTPTYAELRNRVCTDGSEWLSYEMNAFMSSKLRESNREYSAYKKWKISSDHRISKNVRAKLSSVKHRVFK